MSNKCDGTAVSSGMQVKIGCLYITRLQDTTQVQQSFFLDQTMENHMLIPSVLQPLYQNMHVLHFIYPFSLTVSSFETQISIYIREENSVVYG